MGVIAGITAILLGLATAAVDNLTQTFRTEDFGREFVSALPRNAATCSECHDVPSVGGSSRTAVMHAGQVEGNRFIAVPGILHTLNDDSESRYHNGDNILGIRVTLSLLGDGLVEAISDFEMTETARRQVFESRGKIHGQVVYAPVMDSNLSGSTSRRRVGRFGWKAQHATVYSAAADALRNELGVPNPLYPGDASTSSTQKSLSDLEQMVEFIRSAEPIKPDPDISETPAAQHGSELFNQIGCAICHVREMHTAPAGTRISSEYSVPPALGNRTFHPFSDYLLHDVGTGDGIVQSASPEYADQSTANKFRTAPLWGLRYRTWLMHDGKSVTYHQAIMRHGGEASEVVKRYERLTPIEKHELREFLNSL